MLGLLPPLTHDRFESGGIGAAKPFSVGPVDDPVANMLSGTDGFRYREAAHHLGHARLDLAPMLYEKNIGILAEQPAQLIAVFAHPARHERARLARSLESEGGGVALALDAQPSTIKVAIFAPPNP